MKNVHSSIYPTHKPDAIGLHYKWFKIQTQCTKRFTNDGEDWHLEWLGQSVRRRKRDHETCARFYRGMEHSLHVCLSMRYTRSRLQSSMRLLAVTKARTSPNQLNNFNVSADSPTPQPPPPVSNVYICMTSALSPLFTLIGVSTLIFV